MTGRDGWVVGDQTGLAIPAHPASLREGGAAFLTLALQKAGTLPPGRRVARLLRVDDCPGGSTGAKLFLTVAYEGPDTGLPAAWFVKFSRDFLDPIRDRNRDQLLQEIALASLSRHPAFPIAVPRTLFGDYQTSTGTGLLITERIGFGTDGIEPHRQKCLDYLSPDMIEHYRAIVTALARLAGSSRSAALADAVAAHFPYDAERMAAGDPIAYDEAQLLRRVGRIAAFAQDFPRLLPKEIVTEPFLSSFPEDIYEFVTKQGAIRRFLADDHAHVALCHWNGNIDNAWFWRAPDGCLQCGLMDWGRVGQMHVGMALWGALSAAEPDMIETHLDALLDLFVAEFAAAGGGIIQARPLRDRMMLYVALMGLTWLMDAPALIRRQLPDLDPMADRFDVRFQENETARVQLHLLTNVLMLWRRYRPRITLSLIRSTVAPGSDGRSAD